MQLVQNKLYMIQVVQNFTTFCYKTCTSLRLSLLSKIFNKLPLEVLKFWDSANFGKFERVGLLNLLYSLDASGGYIGLVLTREIFDVNALRGKYTNWIHQICRISSLGGKLLWD